MSTTTKNTPAKTTKPAKKDESQFKSAIIGAFWKRESTFNVGQKYLSGKIRFGEIGGPTLEVTAYNTKEKKNENSPDVNLFAKKEDLEAFLKAINTQPEEVLSNDKSVAKQTPQPEVEVETEDENLL